jgi:hypothetical protein
MAMRAFSASKHRTLWTRTLGAVAGAGLAFACSSGGSTSDDPPLPPAGGPFESDDPTGVSARDDAGEAPTAGAGTGSGGSSAGGGTSGSGGGGAVDSGGDGGGERAIAEADVVAIEDGKLYALSRYSGLSVVDVSVQDQLRLMGKHKIVATPFEMYVRGGIVFALYNGYADYTYDAGTELWTYYQTSYVIALDARDPGNIVELGRYEIPGEISDSRIVGDVLYVAAYENGYCWGCGDKPVTNVMSLDVADSADIHQVDLISFEERDGYSWRRSLSATNERLYIAGPVWGESEPTGSVIQVVDIADPSGDMVEGDAVEVAGQIESRWQMDEHEGVLRVISQPFAWRVDRAPAVETFSVVSSAELVKLGHTELVLPRPERLQSVRFDGPRGYAITFEQTDPLFTIDLADPAAPRQVGELEMPGWVYHMEPRGDRVLGLGFDQGNPDGAITVSLFDVSDMAAPAMVSRVNFGGDWGSLAEDQDRIHKAFKVLDAEELILVPFSGWSYQDSTNGCYYGGEYVSGVQLIDWANDSLTLRGAVPSVGEARRAMLHDGRLLTMSDERVESFDIADRTNPQRTASLPIALWVNNTAKAGNHVARVSQNWWTEATQLDLTLLGDVANPVGVGTLELSQLSNRSECGYSSNWLSDVHGSGDDVYLLYQSYSYDQTTGVSTNSQRVLTVDASDPSAPSLVADVELGNSTNGYYYSYYGYYGAGIVSSGSSNVALGSTLVFSNRTVEYLNDGYRAVKSELRSVDLSDPSAPVERSVALPPSTGFTGLLKSGSLVATSHYEPSPTPGRVRFYLDRVDFSDPSAPVVLPSVNIPGSLIAYDADSSHAVTADYQNLDIHDVTYTACNEQYGSFSFEPYDRNAVDYTTAPGVCHARRQSLRLVAILEDGAAVVDTHTLEIGETVTTTSLGDDRLFLALGYGNSYYWYGASDVYYGGGSFQSRDLSIVTLAGIRSGRFAASRIELPAGDSWGYAPLAAAGKRAVVSTGFRGKLQVIDATNAAAPEVVREVELSGYVQDLDIVDGTALASMGYDGVQAIRLED